LLRCSDYQSLDALALAEGLQKKVFTAEEAVGCAITLAEKLNPVLNAITTSSYDQGLALARQFDKNQTGKRCSPLAGVPFLIKDIGMVAGLPFTHMSRLFTGEVADRDSAIVHRFNEAGLISLGKTNTPELCLTITTESLVAGPCRNPWHTQYSTGGSSGGSAAAVAARIVPVAHASDGGGSIRIPASCCGLVGLKPSRGLTPVDSTFASCWSGMSVSHVVSRSVRDSAAMLDILKLKSPQLFPLPASPKSFLQDLARAPEGLRVAVQSQHPRGAEIHPEVLDALNRAKTLLQSFGFSVEEAAPPIDYQALASNASTLICTHVAETVIPQLTKRGVRLEDSPLEESTRRMSRRGREILAVDFLAAFGELKTIEQQMQIFHKRYDLLLSPVMTQPPAPLGWLDMNSTDSKTYNTRFGNYSGFAALFNATGQPSIAIPLHQGSSDLPIGIMLSAAWGADSMLLQTAARLESAAPWVARVPTFKD
jgi:amidase